MKGPTSGSARVVMFRFKNIKNVITKLLRKFKIGIRKLMDSLTSKSETSKNIFLFAFILLFVSF